MTNNPHFGTAIDALLALEQGFELMMEGNKIDSIRVLNRFKYPHHYILPAIYPTPETAHLLEPQKGDLIHIVRGFCSYYNIVADIATGGTKTVTGIWSDGEHWDITTKKPLHDWEIIQRNGKPFPKVVGGV